MTTGPRTLADGKIKFTICTTEPANPAAPTPTELNAGIDASDNILHSDFLFRATDSDKITDEKPLSAKNNQQALGASNHEAGITPFRIFDETGASDPENGDDVFQAVREKGTDVWCYARETAKDAAEAWADGDEIYLGGHLQTDTPQKPTTLGGYIKRRVPLVPQTMYDNITCSASGGSE